PTQDRQAGLPVDPAFTRPRPATEFLPARGPDCRAPQLPAATGRPGPRRRPAHPARAEGLGVDEREADGGGLRRDWLDRPEDYSGHPGRRTRPVDAGTLAEQALQEQHRHVRSGPPRQLARRTPVGLAAGLGVVGALSGAAAGTGGSDRPAPATDEE